MRTKPGQVPSIKHKLRLQAQLLNAVDQAVIATDLDGRIVFWNRFAETLYGWPSEDVFGRYVSEITPAPSGARQAADIMARLRAGESWSGERALQRRDGTTFIGYVTSSPIFDEDRTVIGIVGISRDITEEKRVQETNRLLAQAGVMLMGAADNKEPLAMLAELAVPELADWCAVHLLQADGTIEQVVLDNQGLQEPKAASRWLREKLSSSADDGLPAVFRSGEPRLVSDASPEAGAGVKSYMIVPLRMHPRTLGAITFVAGKSGRHFDQETLGLAENLASHISIYMERARQYREAQTAKDELARRVAERTAELRAATELLERSESAVQILLRVTRKLNATLDVDVLLDELAQEAIALVNGEIGFAGVRTPAGMTTHKYYRHGHAIPYEYTWAPGDGVPGWVLVHKIPWGTSDAQNDPQVRQDHPINVGVHNIICTPVLGPAGEVLGFFDIRNKLDGSSFTIADQDMLLSITQVASVAMQNALAFQQRAIMVADLKGSTAQLKALAANLDSAREQERTEIARELHDQLGQSLTVMKFDLAWLTDRVVQKDASLAFTDKVKNLKLQMDSMIKAVRRIATELRPGMLDDLGLAASIEWQAHDFQKRTGIECVLNLTSEDLRLERPQSLAMFRIFQEALTNVARHARARKINVNLFTTDTGLTLEVRDDGRGIRPTESMGPHSLGLIGMRERAQRLGGTFSIQGGLTGGTLLTVFIPVKRDDSSQQQGGDHAHPAG